MIEKYGFKAIYSDTCVYHHPVKKLYLCIYVDDGLLFAKSSQELQKQNFDIRIVKGSTYVVLEILRYEQGFFIH